MTQQKDRLDLIIKQVFEKMRNDIPQPAICPDDEILGAYIENRLSEKERDRTEEHLALCRKCTENIVAISEIETSPPYTEEIYASPNMVRRAKDLIKPKETDGILKRLSSWITDFRPIPVMAAAAVILFVGITVFYQVQTSHEPTLKTPVSIKLSLLARTPSGIVTRGETPHYREVEISDGGTLRSGDMFRVEFKLKKEAYVYILSLDSLGNLAKLFPDRDSEAHSKFKSGRAYAIPMKDRWFRLDDNTGRETVYLIASPKALEDIEKRIEELKKPRPDQISRMFPGARIESIGFRHE
ncbi:MAG: DUF4384 domain-containing protein [Desulfobacteraceae bacterium]|nr:DUF4384 domain-containing protein [Desulfobacteraceae bacterium]